MMTSAPPQSPPTRPGLLPNARHLVLPAGIVSTGWPSVREVCRQVGIEFDPWQADANSAILAKNKAGMYAADVVGMSICRQAGKTYDIGGILFADCIINPGTLAVWTAHHFTVTREAFWALKSMAELPQMWPHVDPKAITTGAGNECIPFRNGSRIMFKARESGAVRGVAKVRRLVLDEGQILSEKAMADLSPTLNQAHNPQIIVMGTPPKPADDAEFFKAMRAECLGGESEGTLWIEFGADPGAKWDDEAQRRKANPSYPHRTGPNAIKRLKKLLTGVGDFEREAFGIWDTDSLARAVFSADQWAALRTTEPPTDGTLAFGVKFSTDGARVALSVALLPDEDSPVYVECLGVADMAEGTAWLVDKFTEQGRTGPLIVVDGKSGAGDFVNSLRAARISARRIMVPTIDDVITAHAGMLSAIREGDVEHSGQPGLDAAIATAGRRKVGHRGGWGIEPLTDGGDVTALESAILARYGLTSATKRRGNRTARVRQRQRGEAVFA